MADEKNCEINSEIGLDYLVNEWPLTKAYVDLFSELDHESERGAVLLVGAALDDALEELLRARLIPSKSTELLLKGRGPMSALSARIDLSHSIGAISKTEYEVLHKLREIRNDCAHVRSIRFNEPPLKDKCLSLKLPYGEMDHEEDPVKRYIIVAQLLVLLILQRCYSKSIALTDAPVQAPKVTENSVVQRVSFDICIPNFKRKK